MRLYPLTMGLAIMAIAEIAVGLRPSLVQSWPPELLNLLELRHRWIDLGFGVLLLIAVLIVAIDAVWPKLRGSGDDDPVERG